MNKLTTNDLASGLRNDVFVQDYKEKKVIEGVRIIEIKRYPGEDGGFEDLIRLDERGCLEILPNFKLEQINRSTIIPQAIKAWHIHLNQEDIWYIGPEDHMILGLWDVRENSSTKDLKMRVVMGNGTSKLVYVPRGVAHGVVNVAHKKGTIIYFVNQKHNVNEPDEYRLAWDKAGGEFWEIEKG